MSTDQVILEHSQRTFTESTSLQEVEAHPFKEGRKEGRCSSRRVILPWFVTFCNFLTFFSLLMICLEQKKENVSTIVWETHEYIMLRFPSMPISVGGAEGMPGARKSGACRPSLSVPATKGEGQPGPPSSLPSP